MLGTLRIRRFTFLTVLTCHGNNYGYNCATGALNKIICAAASRRNLASYPGHVFGGKSGLVSTVCACANNSGNFPRTSPNTDKLHLVVMRRNNQTRYTACSVAAVFTRRSVVSVCLVSRLRKLSNPSRQPTTSCQLLGCPT